MHGISFTARRLVLLVFVALTLKPHSAHAGRAEDLVRLHTEAVGGKEWIAALKALRASGQVSAGGKVMRFTLIAARPDRVRVETENGNRTLVQATDGRNPAWEFDTGEWPPHYRDMSPAVAKTFTADAEFDDPLVAGPSRGYSFEYAGELPVDGKKMLRMLVTHRLTESFTVLLDPDTYFIVRRIEHRRNTLGTTSMILTQFADFRPVQGVLLPHRIAMAIDGQVKQRTQIDAIEPNPETTPETFSRPRPPGDPK